MPGRESATEPIRPFQVPHGGPPSPRATSLAPSSVPVGGARLEGYEYYQGLVYSGHGPAVSPTIAHQVDAGGTSPRPERADDPHRRPASDPTNPQRPRRGRHGRGLRARDTRLDRVVAIKVLPAAFASDPSGWPGSSGKPKPWPLSHPNILAIFDTGVQDTQRKSSLNCSTARRSGTPGGPLTVRKAVEIAVQIAEAWPPRTPKGSFTATSSPRTSSLLGDGQVKILDFGLAKPIPTGTDETAAP